MLGALHFLTHIGLSWVLAMLGPGPRKDRWLIVLAGVVLDLDGIGILWSEQAYATYHRAAGHGLLLAALLVVVALRVAQRPGPTVLLVAVSFHLHVLLDLVGTGGLPIRYFWPFADQGWTYSGRWVLDSWQNRLVMTVTLLGVLATGWRARHRSAVT